MIEDAPEAFESEPEPGVAKFAELICGEDFQDYVMMYANDDDHHWEDDDHHWEDDDHHWEDGDHHWEDDDHEWNQDFHFAGEDLGCKPSKERQ